MKRTTKQQLILRAMPLLLVFFSLSVAEAKPNKKLQIIPDTISLERGKLSQVQIFARGGVKPYAFLAKSMPTGLALSSDGIIAGTPQYEACGPLANVQVTDSKGKRASSFIKISTVGDSYDLSFTEKSAPFACPESLSELCVKVDFTVTNFGYARPIDQILISIPVATQAGVGEYKRFTNLNITKGQSYNFDITIKNTETFFSFLEIYLQDKGFEADSGCSKVYNLSLNAYGNYVVRKVQ
jgi:hypothetical protein